jgi:5-methylcytosine-specific restriction endonuclease McrA
VAVVETENAALADLSLDQLEDELATLASHIYAGTCRWLELVAEVDRRGGFAASSTAEWLAWRCALTPRAAREHVRVARCLGELQLIHEAFACGELSYAKVRALTRVAEAENEEELLELARHMTASQLERAVRAYRYVTADEADELHALAYAGYTWEPDGSLVLRARLAPEDGALFLRALEAARDRLQEREWTDEHGSAEPRRPTSAEALVALADMSLRGNADTASAGERYQVVVHVEPSGGSYALEDGPALAAETAERLACDASVVEIVERDGVPLSVGRKTRTIPPAIRRALQARDRRCQFPGCENKRFLHAHHIQHWARGGETKLDNLVLLCPRHHRFVHEAGYSIASSGGGKLEFRDPWGAPIPHVPRPPPGDPRLLVERNHGLHIDSMTCDCGDGDRLDLGLAVDALVALAGPRNGYRRAVSPV